MLQLKDLTLNIPAALKPRVVVIGGGFAAVNFVQQLPDKLFQVVMLSKQNYSGFWPLLYQVATAALEPTSIAEPIRKMFDGRPNFHFRYVRVTGIDPGSKTVATLVGDIPYDVLVIATGTQSNYFGNEEIKHNSFRLKELSDAVKLRSQLLQCFEQATLTQSLALRAGLLNIVIAGGGPTGVELAGALAELRSCVLPKDYPGLDFSEMHIYLVEGENRVLAAMSPESSRRTQADLEQLGVIVQLNIRVVAYDGQTVTLDNGQQIQAQTLVWSAGVIGTVVAGLPVESVERHRYLVNDFNQVLGVPHVFAIGDVALMKTKDWPRGHPQLAQPAIQQGRHLAQNLVCERRNQPWKPFNYFNKGTLAIVGRSRAVGDLPGNIKLSGFTAWVVWLFVHVFGLIGFRNKLLVLVNWSYQLFTFQGGARIIVQPLVPPLSKAAPQPRQPQPVS